jgi:hypothetical protein
LQAAQFCVRFLGEHVASAALVISPGNGCDMLARIRLKVFHWLGHVQYGVHGLSVLLWTRHIRM